MTPSSRESAALARRFLTDVVAGGDDAAARAFMADDATVHDLVFGTRPGAASVTARIRPPFVGPELDIDVADLVATADRVAVRGALTGVPPETGTDGPPVGRVAMDHGWFCRVEAGRIAELCRPDGLGLLQQLEVMPSRTRSRRRLSDREDSDKC